MGNANKNSGYSSFGYGVGLQWLPLQKQGLAATAGYSRYRMNQLLRNYNNLTLGYTDNDIIDWKISYRKSFGTSLTVQPTFDGSLSRRKGTENLFGTSAGSSYDKIGSRSPYSYDLATFRLLLPVQIGRDIRSLTLTPVVVYESNEEKYSDPLRKSGASHIMPGLQTDFSAVSGKNWLWETSVGAAYAKTCHSEVVLTDLDPQTSLGQCVISNYEMRSADRLHFNAGAGVSRQFANFILSLKISYRMADYRKEGLCHGAAVTLAAEF